MSRKLPIAVLAALIVASPAAAKPVQVMPGVTYDRILQWTPAGPRAMYVITAPKPGGLYSLAPLLSNGTIVGRETVSSMERNASSQMTTIGVNGDFFSWNGGWPSGLLIRGGVVEHQSALGRASIGIDTSGVLHVDRVPWFGRWHGADPTWQPIAQLNEPARANATALFTPVWGTKTPATHGTMVVLGGFPPATPRRDLTGVVQQVLTDSSVDVPADGAVLVARGAAARALHDQALVGMPLTIRIPLIDSWASITDAVSSGPTLVRNGRPIFNAGEALTPAQLRGRNPRTAIGQRADGTLVMVAVDGRQPGWSVGITNWELAQTLVRYGCVTGFALDSGGSTTVAFDGQVLNRPSDPHGERPVGEALVIGYTGVYVPAPAPNLSPNADGVGEREALDYKLVRPSTVSAKLTGPDGTPRELDSGEKPAGRYHLTWDGTDPAGAPAPEGTYHWNVSATDDLGRASTQDRRFTLDRTVGFLRVSRSARRVAFTLTREATVRVTIETRSGAILRTVAKGNRQAGNVAASWNGRDGHGKRVRRGAYVVHVSVTSPIGLSQLRARVLVRR
jgi:flagellar hook assembly protein FlgD